MIRLATVFSGIGAVEHALKRMGITHEIVFASDNGDVDIFRKKIDLNFEDINIIIDYIEKTSFKLQQNNKEEDTEYLYDIDSHVKKVKNIINQLQKLKIKIELDIHVLSDIITSFNELPKNKVIPIPFTLNEVSLSLQDLLNLDSCKDKLKFDEEILDGLFNKKYKMYKSELSQAIEELYMADEKIQTLNILSELKNLSDYKDKKKYIDALYASKLGSNYVRKSYFANYDITDEKYHWNVSFIDGNQYHDKVDLFVGGSPCQSFSLVGKQKGLADTRGTLFYEYARLVKEIQPKVFIYENVKAVLSNDDGKTWSTMTKIFDDLGYTWQMNVLNAKDYGIPQNRERIFVVGIRNNIKTEVPFSFPDKIPLLTTMKDFLIENVSGKYYLNKKGVDFVTSEKNIGKRFTQVDGEIQLCQKKNQQFNWHGDFVFVEENHDMVKTMGDLEKYFLSEKVCKYVLASGTKNFYSKPAIDLDIARPLLTTMHKMHRAGVDNYVTTDGRIRKLTPRECLRLMGFCDSFKIVVSDTQAYQQAGNSIVVDVLINIVKSILETVPKLVIED